MSQNVKRQERLRWYVVADVGALLLLMIILAMTGKLNPLIYSPVNMQNYWVTIPSGEFQMGSDPQVALAECTEYSLDCVLAFFQNEAPVHAVYLDTFEIGRYEVTNRQYDQCVRAGICGKPRNQQYNLEEYELHPVTDVSWNDAQEFCTWVGGRLPTEAEWEKAASGIDRRTFPWGKGVDCDKANFRGDCVGSTTPVGSYESGKSSYGTYDMAGNVYEWVNDWFSDTYYSQSPYSNPIGAEVGDFRVLRGGSWEAYEIFLRCASRHSTDPESTRNSTGFRCARSLP